MIMKRALVIGATLLLCACGHSVRTQASLGRLVVPGTAPWLQVAAGPDKVDVRGLDQSLTLEPDPTLSAALQSQLGQALQPDYFADLIISCDSLATEMRVNQKKAPGAVAMDLSIHCTINADGREASQTYQVKPSAAVGDAAGDTAYAQALPTLLAAGAKDLATQLDVGIKAILKHR